MKVHLINPSALSFGVGVITPRWLYVLAAATPETYGDPDHHRRNARAARSVTVSAGDVVGIGIHTGNALRGYEIGTAARAARRVRRLRRHPRHAVSRRGARARRRARGRQGRRRPGLGSGARRLRRAARRSAIYDGGTRRRRATSCRRAGICCPPDSYMWASVQTVRGCPKHCSFCSVWRTDGQEPRQRARRRGRRARSSSCGAAASGSSRSPTTTSIRSRSTISRMARAPRRPDAARTSSRRCAPSASS